MLIGLLRAAASEVPDQPVVLSEIGSTTYQDCLDVSERCAGGLHARGVERFACLLDDAAGVVAVLSASSWTGSEACVYPDNADDETLARLVETFDHRVIVTDRRVDAAGVRSLSMKELSADGAAPPPAAERSPALILTTGTTGHQKGARHDWSHLVASVRQPDARPGTRWLLAYNLSQFAGIQMLLHVLVSKATLVVPASRHPADVLAAMQKFGVTHVSATPTFWRFLIGVLDEDAAGQLALKQITMGGEAVPDSLLERARRLFPKARISQVYGATEFGLGISVTDGRSGLPRSVLERGEDAEVQFRVVEGEMYVRSRIGMLGYKGEPDVDEGWRPTGDLVEIRGDRVHFVGRATEIINVGGVKVHPLPVEELVSGLDGVVMVRAFGRPNPVTGQIVAVEVVPQSGADVQQLERSIRTACEALPPAARPRSVRFVPELEVRGHKVARGLPAATE